MSKVCSVCETYKDYSEFNKLKASLDGYSPACKSCARKRLEDYYNSWGGGVYLITTECNQTYIGSTNKLRYRKLRHTTHIVRSSDSKIAGEYSVKEFRILEVVENYTRKEGRFAEQKWIDKLNPTLNKLRAVSKKVETSGN